jgi:glutamate--cysteine ligase
MSLTRQDPELECEIEDVSQLAEFFRAGETPPEQNRVGTEHEKIGLYADDLAPIPYEGDRGIAALLAVLHREYGFEALRDGENLVGLERDGASITLEPGGQLELSGAPLSTLHETCREFNEHVALMKHVSERFGIAWLGLGIHPLARLEDLPRMPRQRYALMREFLDSRGSLALWMMHGTGTVQANFDFSSEADAARKLRLALAASPIITALYANSGISEGAPNGFESRRAEIWRHTDPDRCGFPGFVFEDAWLESGAYARYAEWALDVPVLFIVRGEQHLSIGGRSFRDYLKNGHADARATLADWNLHLTTLFPEARMKRVIEVRGADAVPPGLVCALPAFWKGLFYDSDSLERALERVRGWSRAQVAELHAEVARSGLAAATPDGPVAELARDLLDLSAAGLARIGDRNRRGETEELFLEPLYEIVDRGSSPGRAVLELWEGPWAGRIESLVEYSKY